MRPLARLPPLAGLFSAYTDSIRGAAAQTNRFAECEWALYTIYLCTPKIDGNRDIPARDDDGGYQPALPSTYPECCGTSRVLCCKHPWRRYRESRSRAIIAKHTHNVYMESNEDDFFVRNWLGQSRWSSRAEQNRDHVLGISIQPISELRRIYFDKYIHTIRLTFYK